MKGWQFSTAHSTQIQSYREYETSETLRQSQKKNNMLSILKWQWQHIVTPVMRKPPGTWERQLKTASRRAGIRPTIILEAFEVICPKRKKVQQCGNPDNEQRGGWQCNIHQRDRLPATVHSLFKIPVELYDSANHVNALTTLPATLLTIAMIQAQPPPKMDSGMLQHWHSSWIAGLGTGYSTLPLAVWYRP
ncbi:hypothetical protein ARMGADRAFT_1036838 [Armillaria gallica]|uniref:Uncharacterized protein n=1 Tax=Armillaria gallica TaxID=47427 RepID=A0A2H3D9E7_ARMGA|nr:hypothetical protein ARMGADRAFT_1036838 [Armillaria gallica]